jgi:hypothetical protein
MQEYGYISNVEEKIDNKKQKNTHPFIINATVTLFPINIPNMDKHWQ